MDFKIDYFLGTCSSKSIGELAEKKGKKFSYNKAKKLIKNYSFEIYEDLSLDLMNPWDYETNIKTIKDIKYLHIVHSAIDYLFVLK